MQIYMKIDKIVSANYNPLENHGSFIYRDIYKNVDEFAMQIARVSVLIESVYIVFAVYHYNTNNI